MAPVQSRELSPFGRAASNAQAGGPECGLAVAAPPPADDPAQPAQPQSNMPSPPPEHWSVDAGDAAQATLVIPADARRQRRFEISTTMTVGLREPAAGAWHQMTVLANGTQQWQRREATHNPGAFDGLDYRFSRSVPVGQTLRVVVSVVCQGGRRRRLVVEAEEVL
jgi:hypothetical protein